MLMFKRFVFLQIYILSNKCEISEIGVIYTATANDAGEQKT